MALDVVHIEYLLSPTMQICGLNGKPLIGGYIEVYLAGTDTKVITYQDFDGTRNPFKIPLKADGRAIVLADPTKSYDIYFYDSFGNLAFSRLNVLNAHGPVYIKGTDVEIFNTDGTLDITQTSISNNTRQFEINTKHKSMGVQEPLYFVEDSPSATIIGLSGEYVTPQELNFQMLRKLDISAFEESATSFMDVDKLEFDQHNKISGYNGSAFAGQGSTDLTAGQFINIADDIISVTGLPTYDYVTSSIESATSSLMPSGDYATREELTAYQPSGDYATQDELTSYQPVSDMTAYATKDELNSKQDAGNYYSASNPSGFITGVDLTPYQTTAGMTAYQQKGNYLSASDSAKFYPSTANPSGYLTAHQSLAGYATTALVSNVSSELKNMIPTGEYELVAGDGITLTDNTATKQTTIAVTAEGTPVTAIEEMIHSATSGLQPSGDYYSASNPSGFITGVDLTPYQTTAGMTAYQPVGSYLTADALDNVSANWNEVSAKLDTTAFSDVSGSFLTAHQDISNLMPKSESANFYPMTGNPSGFLTAHQSLDGYLQDSDLAINDNKVTAISGVPLAACGSVVSPLNTILVDGNNIEATNSAVGTVTIPAFTSDLGSVSIYDGSLHALGDAVLPASGATIHFYTDRWANEDSVVVSGKDANGNIASVTGQIWGAGDNTFSLGSIVSAISARSDGLGWIGDFTVSATKNASTASGVYELAWKNDTFSGKNRTLSGSSAFSADVDSDFRLSVKDSYNVTKNYSLLGAYAQTNALSSTINQSQTLIKPSTTVEMSDRAFRHANTTAVSADYLFAQAWGIDFQCPATTAKKYLAVVSFDDPNNVTTNSTAWHLVSHDGTRYTFATKLDDLTDSYHSQINFATSQAGAISNVEASAMTYDGTYEYDELAFKSDLTGSTIPTEVLDAASAVSANSATWNTVTAKLDTTAFSNVSGGFLTAVPDTYLQNTDLTIVDNKVTEISGVPLSAGDELPATVMDTSGLEYNSQGYINGYNGSAVATIDQERQWFTHDDTLCHVSNSAQYALGVNMSAISADLARMMGVDETVLFTGSNQSPALSDSIWNYKKVLFVIGDDMTATKLSNSQMYYTNDISAQGSGFSIFQTCKRKDGGYISMGAYIMTTNGGSAFSVQSVGGWASWDNSTCKYNGAGTWSPRFYKVIGIGRKS